MSTALVQRTLVCPAARFGGGPDHLPGGCRCLVDAAPTHQFMRSLAALGWSFADQARLADAPRSAEFSRILSRYRVERGTALRVARLYDRLWDVPGPSLRTVRWAARCGWEAPDRVVVARLVAGIRCPHTKVDWEQAVRILAAKGLTTNAIALRVGSSQRRVRKATTDLGRAAA